MNLFHYFGLPIVFILTCMMLLRLAAVKSERLHWMTRSAGRWLGGWTVLGFGVAVVLGFVACMMNTDYIASHAQWVWPFCMGLVALNDNPTAVEILIVLGLAGVQNGILYFLLALSVELGRRVITRARGPRNESPSILGR